MAASKEQQAGGAPARSPSPSGLSTASSGSPLIRSHSSASSASCNSIPVSVADGAALAGPNSAGRTAHQQAKRPAPTSIAAAQLQQQQQQQHLSAAGGRRSSASKQQNGNKLAHMALSQQAALAGQQQSGRPRQQVDWPAGQTAKKADCAGVKQAAGPSKGLGYSLGKLIAYKASR